jgi:hypothetical protein
MITTPYSTGYCVDRGYFAIDEERNQVFGSSPKYQSLMQRIYRHRWTCFVDEANRYSPEQASAAIKRLHNEIDQLEAKITKNSEETGNDRYHKRHESWLQAIKYTNRKIRYISGEGNNP